MGWGRGGEGEGGEDDVREGGEALRGERCEES